MLQTLVRLFVILLALAVSPLHASSVLHNGAPARGTILAEALTELPAPLTEEAFFEAVNAAGAGIYSVGGAQGTQAMLVSISITVPGNPPLTASDADAPLTGTPPSSAVDSFFDDPSPTLVWGYDQEPNVLAGSDLPEVQTEIVELDLRSVDPVLPVDRAWYPLTIDSAPNVTTAALDAVETEIVQIDLRGGLTLTDDAVGVGLFDLGGPLSICGADPGAPLCSQVGGIITSAVDLLNDCAGIRSEVCTEIVSLDLVGSPDAHVIILNGFNDAPGPYTLQITEEALGLCTSDDPFAAPPPECGGLLDVGRSLVGFNDACNGNDSPLCDLNRPGDFSVDSFIDIFFDISSDPTLVDNTVEAPSDVDWYTFTIDPPAVAPSVLRQPDDFDTELWLYDDDGTLTLDPDATGISLFSGSNLLTYCGGDGNDTLCGNAAGVVANGIGLLNDCAGSDSPICTELLSLDLVGDPTTYFIIVDGFGSAAGDGFYTLNITLNAVGLCDAGNPGTGTRPDECDDLLGLTDSILGVNDACNGITAPPCDQIRPGSVLDEIGLSDFSAFAPDLGASTGGGSSGSGAAGSSTGSGAAPRSVTVIPGSAPGHLTLTETAPGSGTFRVTEAVYYSLSVTDTGHLRSIFGQLPEGSVLITDDHRIRPAPDGSFLYRDEDGHVYTVTTMPPNAAPDWYPSLIELTPDNSDPNKTVLTGEDGTRVTIPAPGVELIDINVDPGAIAVTADEITATTESADGGLVALITASGGSTGEVFDLRFFNALNSGKLAIIEGDAIFEPLPDAEATAARNVVADLMGGVNSVTNGPGTAYCVEQDNAVPTTGQLFRFANSAKQRELAFASQVLDGAREVEAAGLLNPDSDATAYMHSIRQWSIWTVEKGFNEASFTESFVEHTRKVLEQNGTQWTGQIEDAVRGLAPNRFRDIRRVVERAGLTVGADDEAPLAAGERRKPRRPLVVRRRGA